MNISDFLPYYPNFDEKISEIFNTNLPIDGAFDIFKKKEFNSLKLEPIEKKPDKKGEFLKHQKAISMYLSTHTPYNNILLFHEPGTGKTCSTVAVIETIKSEKNSYKGALILMKGQNLIENYKNELVNVCTDGIYLPDSYNTANEKKRRIKKKINDFYNFNTYNGIAKIVKDQSQIIEATYSNLIIVLDEIHNLRLIEDKSIYTALHKFLHTVKNCKIILLSGTPMVDKPEEISGLMNLILPLSNQLETGTEFKNKYLDSENKIKKEMINQLKSYFYGKISYLKSMKNDIKRKFIGDLNIGYLNLYAVKSNDTIQSQVYSENVTVPEEEKDEDDEIHENKEGGFYNISKETSLFVFPDGSYGKKGFAKYITQTKSKIQKLIDKKSDIVNFRLSNDIVKLFNNKTIDEKLSVLSNFSAKYTEVIKNILKSNGNQFVYINIVHGSGAILFSKILELFGFTKFAGTRTPSKGLKYSIITGSTSTKAQNSNILDTFNSPDNVNGELIKVIIGSEIISEGFTLKNVQGIHILTPDWNYSRLEQAIARGIRLFSHDDLLKINQNIEVKIFLYCYIVNGKFSLDKRKYEKCQKKDVAIKFMEKIIMESSYDCFINKNRNQLSSNFDGLRECNYGKCDYKCDVNQKTNKIILDENTYNLYYNKNEVIDIIENIKKLIIEKNNKLYINEIKSLNKFSLYKAIDIILTNNMYIKDPDTKLKKYFCYTDNYLFLSYQINGNFSNIFYVNNIFLHENSSPELFNKQSRNICILNIKNILSKKILDEDDFISFFPLWMNETILETCIKYSVTHGVTVNCKLILKKYEHYLYNNNTVSSLFFEKYKKIRVFKNNNWSTIDDITEINKILKKKERNGKNINYIGIIEKGKFKIRDTSSEKNKGKECATWSHPELLRVIDKTDIDYMESKEELTKEELIENLLKSRKSDFTEDELKRKNLKDLKKLNYYISIKKVGQDDIICTNLRKWFEKNNLIEYKLNVK